MDFSIESAMGGNLAESAQITKESLAFSVKIKYNKLIHFTYFNGEVLLCI